MRNSYILLHVAIFLAGCTGIFGKLIQLNEFFITWYRMLFAAIAMLFIMLFDKKHFRLTSENLKIASVGFILGLHWIFFYGSIRYANVSVGVICCCLSSFFTALLVPLIRKVRLSVVELLLSGLTIAGILLIFHFDGSFRIGITLGVISSLLFSLFTVLNEGINKVNDIRNTTFYEMLGGVIGIGVLLPVYLYFFPAGRIVPQPIDFVYLLLLSLVCTVSMYLLLNKAQRNTSAFTVSLSFNLEPIYAIVLAILIFHEDRQLTSSFYIGLALIILSLLLQIQRVTMQKKQRVT